MDNSVDFPQVTWITVGTIGEPGQRIFLMQAGYLGERISLKMEKIQVASLVQYIAQLLSELARPGELESVPDLSEPLGPDWVAGSIALAYSPDDDLIRMEIIEASNEDTVPSSASLGITREQGAALAIEGTLLVKSGRPLCPLCGYPLDPKGHNCPRTNGHRPPAL